MKTVSDVFYQAMSLLGYTNAQGTVDGLQSAELLRRALAVVNQVAADLWPLEMGYEQAFEPLTAAGQAIPLSAQAVDGVMPFGAAMYLAQAEGDGANQQFYAALYEQKRQAVRRVPKRRGDALPNVWAD